LTYSLAATVALHPATGRLPCHHEHWRYGRLRRSPGESSARRSNTNGRRPDRRPGTTPGRPGCGGRIEVLLEAVDHDKRAGATSTPASSRREWPSGCTRSVREAAPSVAAALERGLHANLLSLPW